MVLTVCPGYDTVGVARLMTIESAPTTLLPASRFSLFAERSGNETDRIGNLDKCNDLSCLC